MATQQEIIDRGLVNAAGGEAELQKARAEDAACPWRPIETAPKDGSYVLTFTPSRRPPHAIYRWREDEIRPSQSKWVSDDQSWYVKGPTHWKPLDDPA